MSVFEYTEIEAIGDLERLELALSGLDDDALMDKLENRRGRGCNAQSEGLSGFGCRTGEGKCRECVSEPWMARAGDA